MKRIFYTIILLIYSGLMLQAEDYIKFTITDADGIAASSSMENTMSALLSEFNNACKENRTPKLSNLNIDKRTQTSILSLWENSPFECEEPEIVEKLLHAGKEYELREIPLIFPQLSEDDRYHEIAVTFDNTGKMTSFHMSLEQYQVQDILKVSRSVADTRQRMIILDYVEQFRTSYNTKDLNFLNQVFSDDALIVTGRVIKPNKNNSVRLRDSNTQDFEKIEYMRQSKATYLKNLASVFKRNKWLNIQFTDVSVLAHPTKENWYGVTLKQDWSVASGYHDVGWVFLLWDFTDPNAPVIHVRTWQPNKLNGRELTEEDVFGFDDVQFN